MSKFQVAILCTLGLVLIGCGSAPAPIVVQEEVTPSYEVLRSRTSASTNGSIFQPGREMVLYEDVKARRVGDILTVMLVEETSGENSNNNSLNQTTAMNVSAPTIAGTARANLGVELGSENAFTGQSGSSQSNRLNGSIAVTVHEVLPNGNLVVQGEKSIRINQGNEFVRLKGVVRPKDINAFNTLYSTQVADARITYAGKGTSAHNSTPGWGAKILFSSLWPF